MLKFNRDIFWQQVKKRNALQGRIRQETVDGVNAIFEAWLWCEDQGILDKKLLKSERIQAAALSNILGNVRREVGIKMMPVFEGFKSTYQEAVAYVRAHYDYGGPRGPYKLSYPGIGQIQLTHWENFKERGDRLGLPLEEKPWEAIKLFNSARIAVSGMSDGSFRKGHKLSRYSHEHGPDGYLGREMVNGDKGYAMKNYGTIGNFIEVVADGVFECLVEAMKYEPDEWDEGDPVLFESDKGEDEMILPGIGKGTSIITNLLRLFGLGGVSGGIGSCMQQGGPDPTQMDPLWGAILAIVIALLGLNEATPGGSLVPKEPDKK